MVEQYERCVEINDLLNDHQEDEARSKVISLLNDVVEAQEKYTPLMNHLIRAVGLLPYLHLDTADWQDRFVTEVFKADIGGGKEAVLHTEQSSVLKRLLAGESLAISAPTSFGKSFIIDAFIAIRHPNIVVLIVPTIALADEARRRLTRKFSSKYKIITTTDAVLAEKSILVFPQERAFAYLPYLRSIDILIVDEFYKASARFDDVRSSTLLNTMIELGKRAKQRYYLAPNISSINDNPFTEGMSFAAIDFKTVITRVWSLYRQKGDEEKKDAFKERILAAYAKRDLGKTLIYAGTYSGIGKVCEILKRERCVKQTELLNDFASWIRINYGRNYQMSQYVRRGFGIHNGQLHRSLSQIQIKLFEEEEGLDTIISTSSIIEGVNTQAENVILWSVKNGSNNIDYFTYRNIIGRAGRAFKYFIGKVFLLEEPPHREATELSLDFPDDVACAIDVNEPGVKLDNDQYQKIKAYHDKMESLLGEERWRRLKEIPQIKAYKPSLLQPLVERIVKNPQWPANYEALAEDNTWEWRTPLEAIINEAGLRNVNRLRAYTCMACNPWHSTIPDTYDRVKDYGIGYEDMFAFERAISFNLSSLLAVINIIKMDVYPDVPDISSFVHRTRCAFLPKLVYQLEEYGLPRMICRKIQNAGVINLEDDSREIGDVISEFNRISRKSLVEAISPLHPFDNYIIKYFYEGIS